jgi:hypothetical protein
MSADERGVIGLSDGQNVQMKSQRSPCVIIGDPRHTCAHAGHRLRQTAAKLTTFMTGLRRLMKAYAILWQKFHACFSKYTFDQGNRVLVSRVATHLDVRDRVSMKTG